MLKVDPITFFNLFIYLFLTLILKDFIIIKPLLELASWLEWFNTSSQMASILPIFLWSYPIITLTSIMERLDWVVMNIILEVDYNN